MQVANIDVKQETPVSHGEVICFSIYSGNSDAEADFGNGKTCIWVDVLHGGRDVLMEFAPFFEDPSIRKVWLCVLVFLMWEVANLLSRVVCFPFFCVTNTDKQYKWNRELEYCLQYSGMFILHI